MQTGWSYVGKQLLFVLIVFVLALLFLAFGLMIGYGVIGSGDNPMAILSPAKWQELFAKFTGN